MRRVLLALLFLAVAPGSGAVELPVLVYHDIVAAPRTTDPLAVTTRAFREQLEYLRAQGYRTVSLHDLAEAAAGRATLPAKPVMLTFDDGLASFGREALPLLAKYGDRAVLSVVTGWLDGRNVPPEYRGRLMSWEDVRRASREPLVEVLVHTDSLHADIAANPQGNVAPASITRRYDAATGRYESEAAFRMRIRADLARAAARLRAETGRSPPGITWPYGYYDRTMAEEATALGMRYQLTLGEKPARTEEFPRVTRVLLRKADTLAVFEDTLRFARAHRPVRLADVELDAMPIDPPDARERWLSALLTRLQLLRVNTVIVDAFGRDGRSAYFQNPRLPVRADVLFRVLNRIQVRVGVDRIVLRLPAIAGLAEAATELARRHPYDGILLARGHAPAAAAALQRLFADHRPGMICGVEQGAAYAGCDDFRVVRIVAGANSAGVGRMDWFVVTPQTPADGGVAATLRALHAAGARHLGIADGAYLDDADTLRRVAVELNDLAKTGGGR